MLETVIALPSPPQVRDIAASVLETALPSPPQVRDIAAAVLETVLDHQPPALLPVSPTALVAKLLMATSVHYSGPSPRSSRPTAAHQATDRESFCRLLALARRMAEYSSLTNPSKFDAFVGGILAARVEGWRVKALLRLPQGGPRGGSRSSCFQKGVKQEFFQDRWVGWKTLLSQEAVRWTRALRSGGLLEESSSDQQNSVSAERRESGGESCSFFQQRIVETMERSVESCPRAPSNDPSVSFLANWFSVMEVLEDGNLCRAEAVQDRFYPRFASWLVGETSSLMRVSERPRRSGEFFGRDQFVLEMLTRAAVVLGRRGFLRFGEAELAEDAFQNRWRRLLEAFSPSELLAKFLGDAPFSGGASGSVHPQGRGSIAAVRGGGGGPQQHAVSPTPSTPPSSASGVSLLHLFRYTAAWLRLAWITLPDAEYSAFVRLHATALLKALKLGGAAVAQKSAAVLGRPQYGGGPVSGIPATEISEIMC